MIDSHMPNGTTIEPIEIAGQPLGQKRKVIMPPFGVAGVADLNLDP